MISFLYYAAHVLSAVSISVSLIVIGFVVGLLLKEFRKNP